MVISVHGYYSHEARLSEIALFWGYSGLGNGIVPRVIALIGLCRDRDFASPATSSVNHSRGNLTARVSGICALPLARPRLGIGRFAFES